MAQSDAYKFTNEVNRVADQVGADQARDVLRVAVVEQGTSPLDVTAATVPVKAESSDAAGEMGARLSGDTPIEASLSAPGAARLVGRVKRVDAAYTVKVRYLSDDGTTLFTDTLASGATGTTTLDEQVIAPDVEVVVEDAAGSTKPATYSVVLR